MNSDKAQLDFETFAAEKDRTYIVFDFFEDVQAREVLRFARLPRKKRKYLRKMSGYGTVTKIHPDSIDWSRRPGEIVTPVCLSDELCRALRVGDRLDLTIGLYQGIWRVLSAHAITNEVGETEVWLCPEDDGTDVGEPPELQKLLN